ncbi:MAG: hypothetical protein JXM73_22420, partial [Anaerolineae bacterium]|nr:hypothetical protein [Anaerolineae bacterium]
MSKPHLNLVRSTLASLSMVLLLFLIPLLSAASAPASATATFAPAGHLETSFLVPYGRLAVGHTGILFSFCPAADNWYCSHSYRSRDEGSMWEMLNSVSGASVNVNDVVASPPGSPEDILFWGVTSWSGTLRISSPDGRTWRVPQQPPEGWVDRFVLSPGYATDGTLYAAMSVEPFLWRSTDWGDHWQGIASPGASRIEHLAASPLLPTDQTLFAALYDDTLWRSTDAGDTWQPADSGLGASALNPIRDVAVVTTDDGGLAALAALSDTLHISFDLGDSWAPRPTVQLRSLYVAPDWATSHTLFAIDHEWWSLYKSTDLGQTWLMAGPATVRDLAFSPDYLDDHTLYAGASQDVWVSRDGGATWTA